MSVVAGTVMRLSKVVALILTSASTLLCAQTTLFARILLGTTAVYVMSASKEPFAQTSMNVPLLIVVMLKLHVQIVKGATIAVVSQDSRATVRNANVHLVSKGTTVP